MCLSILFKSITPRLIMWTILATKSVTISEDGNLFPVCTTGVLSIEQNEWDQQRARWTDGFRSVKVDVAYAWAMME